jgi:hypothetical protein
MPDLRGRADRSEDKQVLQVPKDQDPSDEEDHSPHQGLQTVVMSKSKAPLQFESYYTMGSAHMLLSSHTPASHHHAT